MSLDRSYMRVKIISEHFRIGTDEWSKLDGGLVCAFPTGMNVYIYI